MKKGGRAQDAPLTDRAVALIAKHYAELAGLDPAQFAGHSLRAGYVTSAVEANAPLMKIVEQTRHKSVDMVRVYSRRIDLFRDHSCVPVIVLDTELALRAALNVLRDSLETGRMPSGIELEPAARAVHEAAIAEFERLLALGVGDGTLGRR